MIILIVFKVYVYKVIFKRRLNTWKLMKYDNKKDVEVLNALYLELDTKYQSFGVGLGNVMGFDIDLLMRDWIPDILRSMLLQELGNRSSGIELVLIKLAACEKKIFKAINA